MGALRGMGIRWAEPLRFAAVGASGVAVNTGALLALTRGAGVPLEWASPLAIEVAILSNFTLNSLWTFRGRDALHGLGGRLGRYHLVAAAAGAVNWAMLLLLARRFGVWDVAANLAGIVAGTGVNYALNSAWTWRRARARPASPPGARLTLGSGSAP